MIEKGGPNLGRARVGRLNEDNELGRSRDIQWEWIDCERLKIRNEMERLCLWTGLCQFSGIGKTA